MKRVARNLAGLYPREWRLRYGKEFDALLEDTNLTLRDLLDVIAGALRMQWRSWNAGRILEGDNYIMRLVDWKHRDIPNGYEVETAFETTRADGGKALVRRLFREVDLGGSYVILNHLSRDSEAAQTLIVYGAKGEVAGDFRTDSTEMLILQADGTVRRSQQTVKTWLKYEAIRDRLLERYRNGLKAGLSPDEIYQKLRRENNPETPAPST